MLSLAATALAQTTGNESGTNQTGFRNTTSIEPVGPAISNKAPWYENSWIIVIGLIASLITIGSLIVWLCKNLISKEKDKTEQGIRVSDPTSTVKISNILHPHNPNFTGRVDLLDRLSEALASGVRAAFTQTSAITGLGGIGKTQLALEYSYRHADDYKVVWWVRSEEPATLAADYAGLAGRLNLPEKASQDQRIIVEAVRRWLEQNEGWLLVFDNAQEPEDLGEYLPKTGKGHVIITSRNPSWGGTAKTLPVDVFSREESIEFLLSRTGQKDGVDSLAEALGDLPLALEQAAAYILATKIELADYLELFQTRRNELWKDEKKPESYREKVETAWTVSMDRVKAEATVGADLLNLCAFLAPDDIPRKLFSNGNEHLPESLADKLAVNRAVDALQRYSLINATPESLSVHRLVQAVARDRLPDEERKRWAEAAVRLVNGAFPLESGDVRTWDVCSVLFSHALAATKYAEELGAAAPRATGRLLNKVGLYLKGRAQFNEAKTAYERALKIDKEVYGPDFNHPDVARTLGNIGNTLRQKGDLDEAQSVFEKVLLIFKEVYGQDSNHPEVARTLMNLGSVLYQKGDLNGAKLAQEKALSIYREVYGQDSNDPEVARTLMNHGNVLAQEGDLDGAKLAYEKALSIDKEVYGQDSNHPEVARTLMNLGNVLAQEGDLDGAKLAYEKALSIDKEVYGQDSNHPEVARTLMNLGNVLAQEGDLDGAKLAYEKALSIFKEIYSPDANHPDVALTLMNLGNVQFQKGDLSGAKKHYERALEICRRRLGEDHPNTITARKNLESLRR